MKEQWSRGEGGLATLRDKEVLLVLEPVRRDSEADGVVLVWIIILLLLEHIHVPIDTQLAAILFFTPFFSLSPSLSKNYFACYPLWKVLLPYRLSAIPIDTKKINAIFTIENK